MASVALLVGGVQLLTRPASANQAVNWAACTIPGFEALQCAKLEVPLDYSKPWKQKIKLSLVRKLHTSPEDQYQGILLANRGGPGADGIGFALGTVSMGAAIASTYDIIGFDPRGVSTSEPALSCDPDHKYQGPVRADYIPANRAEERAWTKKAADYANACGAKYRELLPHMTSANNARDMDAIRQALGQDKLTYVGISWGTYLGANYATLFPNRVRRMVLDSIVRPSGVWYDDNIDQNHAFEANFRGWAEWAAGHNDVYGLGATADAVQATYYATRAKLKATPAENMVGPSEFDDTMLSVGYFTSTWLGLTDALSKYVVNNETGPLVEAYGGAPNDNSYSIYLATECSDARWPRDWQTWHRDMWRSHAKSPFLTWGNAWFNAPCAYWPTRAQGPVDIRGKRGLPGVLFLQNINDGATPYPGAVEVHKLFPTSKLVLEPGLGDHGTRANPCVNAIYRTYLGAGTLPASDVTCTPRAVPDPNAVMARSEQLADDFPAVPRS
ncbi:alpha/beta hydrolase [Nonomuraea sp. NPDC050556]|uniref:alpha/beta hydrolase n=1 Tax=Nonomuraea sp. NPDC050556 TaxID=3364369 RepID=UPI00379E375D